MRDVYYLYTDILIISGIVLYAVANLKECAGLWASQTVQVASDRVNLWKLESEGVQTVNTNIAALLLTY